MVVAFLTAAVGVEFFHRQLLAIALEPLRADLGVSDTQLGALVFAFAAAYAAQAVALGRIADRGSRRNIYAAGIATWSVATALGAACGGFASFLVTRLVAGAAQGASGACNGPLLADYVPPEKRSGALGLLAVGAALGVVAALTAGGYATERLGWRATFVLGGLFGVLFALALVVAVQEPPRGWSEGRSQAAGARPSLREAARVLAGLPALRHSIFGAMLANTALLAVAQWAPAFFVRVHHMGLADAGAAGGVAALFAVGGGVAGGLLADRAWLRAAASVLRIPGYGLALAFPLGFAAFRVSDPWVAIALLVAATGLGMLHAAPVGAVVQALAPLRMRALISGLFNASLTLIGMGGGPLLTGWLSDVFDARGDAAGLGRALSWISLFYLWAAVHLLLAARSFVADLERSRAASG